MSTVAKVRQKRRGDCESSNVSTPSGSYGSTVGSSSESSGGSGVGSGDGGVVTTRLPLVEFKPWRV